jgi:hypothetical protein
MTGWASADSDWSNVQTFTISGTPPSANPTQPIIQPTTPTSPSVPEFSPVIILSLFVIIPLIMSLLLRKRIHLKAYN